MREWYVYQEVGRAAGAGLGVAIKMFTDPASQVTIALTNSYVCEVIMLS